MRNTLLAALVLALPGAAFAEEAKNPAAPRIAYFTLVGTEMNALVAMVKGETEYDAAKASRGAADLVALTQYSGDDLMAPGTSNADLPGKTRALPKIWEDMAGYGAAGKAFGDAVTELAAVAGNGKDALAPAVAKLGGTCKGCHDTYRAKDF
ncbi:cytochrome C [Rhodobacter veldkampii DSM 11550]|uniref:Cytochrome C n=1 Tax=Phaeovulum veldkampii DSM 11550 TaxID=1185920 RepID=A0A2T4JGC9_9RHOB|nr:cytochrome c [Phaeovulum veldkampii]MBK5946772.1 cytochrome C [Phaeovulum veldkampii DSM 11550]NCU20684.1 cytochrome c [Candidatus Falkowbacteria bacterium]PTE16847.1 cytochrome C [Phaeovulum veldkampii DSM 11550]TDQ56430.1 cytochrome c556 [Phaeovulum veldkampii DSM 11550]